MNEHSAPPNTRQESTAQEVPADIRLITRLQRSLDPRQVLIEFFEQLRRELGLQGLRCRFDDGEQAVQLGNDGRCSRVYSLTLESEAPIGELTLSRDQPFDSSEIARLERALTLLAAPLHNAVLYQQALAASRRDPLTGLGNRQALEECLAREVELGRRCGAALSVLVLEIDNLVDILRQHGRAAAERSVLALTQGLEQRARCSDMLFRDSSDRFVVVMSHTDDRGAAVAGERLAQALISVRLPVAGGALRAQVFWGCGMLRSGDTARSLLRRAETGGLEDRRTEAPRVAIG